MRRTPLTTSPLRHAANSFSHEKTDELVEVPFGGRLALLRGKNHVLVWRGPDLAPRERAFEGTFADCLPIEKRKAKLVDTVMVAIGGIVAAAPHRPL